MVAAADAIVRFIGSRSALIIVLSLFVLSSVLVALSMSQSIYDEHWHVGIIEAYSGQFSPRLRNSLATVGLGDVEFTGSFLFHWLMSFPYRVFAAWFGEGFVSLVLLRLTGIVLVTAGLIIWRRTVLLISPSTAIANTVVAVMVSIPLLGFVAATVNYDNLLFTLTAAWFYFVVKLIKDGGTRALDWAWMLVAGLAASITKFSFAPVLAVVVVYLAIRYFPTLIRSFRAGTAVSGWKPLIVPGTLLILVVAAVTSRYVVNLVSFGTPDPSCDLVAPRDYCMTYGVFARNEGFAAENDPGKGSFTGAIGVFFGQWLSSMISTLSWVGVRREDGWVLDSFGGMITRPLLYLTAIAILTLALLLGRVIAAKFRWPILIALAVHTTALFFLNYNNLVQYGLLYAYSARYFFPYLPGLIFLAVAGLALTLKRISSAPRVVAVGVFFLAMVFMTQGGGPITYLNAVTDEWIHPESPIRGVTLFLGRVADQFFMIG